jgi:hypothetical protein
VTGEKPRHPGLVVVNGMTTKDLAIHLDDLEFAAMMLHSHKDVEIRGVGVGMAVEEDRVVHEYKTRIGTVCHTWQTMTDQDSGRTTSTTLLEMNTSGRICIFSIEQDIPNTRPDTRNPHEGTGRMIETIKQVLLAGLEDDGLAFEKPGDDHLAAHATTAANASGLTVEDLDSIAFATPWSPALLEKTDDSPKIMIKALKTPVVTSVMKWNDGAERIHVGQLLHVIREESLDPMRMMRAQAEIASASKNHNTQAKRIAN